MIVLCVERMRARLFICSILKNYAFILFNDTATTEIYTLSLHDALPISERAVERADAHEHRPVLDDRVHAEVRPRAVRRDRKSTRLNSSHANISYAVFCLKKKEH